MGIGAWGSFFDKLISKLPIQNRIERWKNQLVDLKKQREELLKGDCDDKKAMRLRDINNRIDKLNELLKNKAQD
jgi:hypothetical protein